MTRLGLETLGFWPTVMAMPDLMAATIYWVIKYGINQQ